MIDGKYILVVDDEAGIREFVRELLEAHGYAVLDAASGAEAVALTKLHAGRIALILTDWEMPAMRGLDLSSALYEIEPNLPVIYMSGYYDSIAMRGVVAGKGIVIRKPFSEADLLGAVRTALA